jgi:hypothetical protein
MQKVKNHTPDHKKDIVFVIIYENVLTRPLELCFFYQAIPMVLKVFIFILTNLAVTLDFLR